MSNKRLLGIFRYVGYFQQWWMSSYLVFINQTYCLISQSEVRIRCFGVFRESFFPRWSDIQSADSIEKRVTGESMSFPVECMLTSSNYRVSETKETMINASERTRNPDPVKQTDRSLIGVSHRCLFQVHWSAHSRCSAVANTITRKISSRFSTTFWLLYYKVQRFSCSSAGFGQYDGEFCLFNSQVWCSFSLERGKKNSVSFQSIGFFVFLSVTRKEKKISYSTRRVTGRSITCKREEKKICTIIN